MKYLNILLLVAFVVALLVPFAPTIWKSISSVASQMAENFTADLIRDGHRLRQGGFVLLSRNYRGYTAGQTVEMPGSMETALVAGGGGTVSAGPCTSGALTTDMSQGGATIAAGAASVVITNPNINAQSVVWAAINQAAADGTALYVARVVPGAGLVTIYVNANATAALPIKWAILAPMGTVSNPT